MKKIYSLISVIVLMFLFPNCSDTITSETEDFSLQWVSFPQTIVPGSSNVYLFEVKFTPFDYKKIGNVSVKIQLSYEGEDFFVGSLADDGDSETGDMNRNDGIFSLALPGTEFTQSGAIVAKVTGESGGKIHQIRDTIQTIPNSPPVIKEAIVPDTLYEDKTIFKFRVQDEDGLETLKTLSLLLYKDESHTIPVNRLDWTQFNLMVDTVVIEVDSTFGAGTIGDNFLTLQLDDGIERITQHLVDPIYVINSAPQILSTSIPDSVQIPTTGTQLFVINARVRDNRGLTDIQQVYVRTGSDFVLKDDGSQETGDEVAGDGIYSGIFSVNSNNSPGSYLFEFHASDKVGNNAPIIQKYLVLY